MSGFQANRIRWCIACALALAIGGGLHIVAAAETPYTAYVNADDVYVRSGPGRNYYPTDKLRKGQKVEIYRHDPGGWLAIRPPRSSFAWVSKRNLDPMGDGLATVNADRVVARVGSTFSDVRDVIQVRLDKGETVELLDAPKEDSPWCKVAPPAGEFRWVFAKYVDRRLPADVAADDRADDETAEGDGVRLTSGESDGEPGEDRSANSDVAASELAGTRAQPTVDPTSHVGQALNRLELELSAMIVDDISAWSFDDLRRRGDDVLREATTPVERGQARIFLGKIERFDDIRRRHLALQRPPDEVDPAAFAPSAADSRAADVSQFDGVGRLSPVISEKVGGPQYALVDNKNAVISFVTPAPGVNLRPYVDHYVGVSGQRGYLTDLQRQHISVQRVTVLETARLPK